MKLKKTILKSENLKVRISLLVQGNVLDWFRRRSEKTGVPYQNIAQIALAEYAEKHGLFAQKGP